MGGVRIMIYTVMQNSLFAKAFRKLDPQAQRKIKTWIDEHLTNTTNPRQYGKALSGNLSSIWRYRIGDYRLICEIKDKELIILALDVGHRKEVYK